MNEAIDIVKLGSFCVGAMGLVIAGYQVWRTIKWNQLNAALTQFDAARIAALEEDATEELRRLDIEFELDGRVLTDDQARAIIEDRPAYTKIKYLLNMLEQNAAAINAGAIHEQFAYHQMGWYYLRSRFFFDALISRAQALKNNERCWEEMDILCRRWKRWRERGLHTKLHRILWS